MAIKRNFILSSGIGLSANNLYLVASIASTNTSTGALLVTGGVGIGGSIFGGSTISAADNIEVKSAKEVRFNNSGNTFYTGLKAGANASNTTYTLPIAFPGSGTSVLQSDTSGTLSWVAMTSGGGSGTVNSGTINSIPYYPATGTAITGSSSFTNVGTGISITYSTPSTSSTTGALVVTGGVGIGDTLFVAGNISVNSGTNGLLLRKLVAGNFGAIYSTNVTPSTTNYSFITDGVSANLNGTTGVYLNISNTNKIQVTTNNVNIVPTADSTSTSTGALTVAGGVGIGGSSSIGGRLQMFNGANYTAFVSGATGNTTYTLPPTSPATGTSVLQSTSAGVLSWVAMTASGGLAVSGSSDGIVQFKSGSALGGTNSLFFDSTLLGLRVSGFPGGEVTAGTDAALKVEQATNSFNGSVNGTMIAVNANSGFSGDLINLQLNAITKFKVSASGAIGMSSDIVTTGIISAGDLTNSTSTTTGSLKIRGGVGITGTVFVGETLNATSSTASTSSTTGALVVTGGVGIGGNVNIGGNLVITQSTEKFLNYTTNIGSGTTVSLAVNTSGGIMYVNTGTVSGNWTLNLTGLATTNGFASSVTLIIAQGSTPYVPSTLSISGVGQSINWQGGSLPSGNANKKDALSYSILSTGSGVTDYVIFGQLVSFG